jgi:hypothetical protein
MSAQKPFPMPLKRTPALSHEPVPAPVYADVTLEEAQAAEDAAKVARQQGAMKATPAVPGLRRTDYDGLVYEPGTTALMRGPAPLVRSPAVQPWLNAEAAKK